MRRSARQRLTDGVGPVSSSSSWSFIALRLFGVCVIGPARESGKFPFVVAFVSCCGSSRAGLRPETGEQKSAVH